MSDTGGVFDHTGKEYGAIEVVHDEHRSIGFGDMLEIWVCANANNGTWYVGGVVAGAAFAGAMYITFIANPIAYMVMALTRPSFGVKVGKKMLRYFQSTKLDTPTFIIEPLAFE